MPRLIAGRLLRAGLRYPRVLGRHAKPARQQNRSEAGAELDRVEILLVEEYRDALKWRAGVTVEIHSEMELATLVLSRSGGVVVAVDVDNSFMTLNRDGICGGGRGPGNHAVHVDDVEIINGELAFDMANSWGLNFGDNGRAYLTWNRHFSNTFRNHQFFAIMGSSYDSLRDEGPAVKV